MGARVRVWCGKREGALGEGNLLMLLTLPGQHGLGGSRRYRRGHWVPPTERVHASTSRCQYLRCPIGVAVD